MKDPRTTIWLKEQTKKVEDLNGSSTVCSAKWLQSTTLLFNGVTHSCHHCPSHKIDPIKVRFDKTLLHNTPQKQQQKEQMLNGERPKECGYCWGIEDTEGVSDRYFKTSAPWATKALNKPLKELGDFPTYLEVAFDHTCNLKCMYCGPEISSKWMQEIVKYGAYPTTGKNNDLAFLDRNGRRPIPNNQFNPYINSFWHWWPTLYRELEVFRITGGEPLLSRHLWTVMESIIDDPNPNLQLELGINTNMSVDSKLVDKFVDYCSKIEGKVKELLIYSSCEATGSHAEYIRYGMDYEQFLKNCERLLENTKAVPITFMMTIGSLSVFTLLDFVKYMIGLRKRFPRRVRFDFGILRYPDFMNIRLIDKNVSLPRLQEIVDYLKENGDDVDVERAQRLFNYAQQPSPDVERLSSDFKYFYNEYDRRRGTDFCTTFPELANMVK